ncbi:hypothetical protein AAJ76_2000042761 [Vairimorpha ceranae]|uniref:Uncharacterized protein n=1 Tax=Vairimorpha ceranae TaxID=40302 RepID=A0A0F9ZD06_9MICR|nr:hypothetical protein AAJ76_2000042761 [Vairimorpha ceranae]KAF5140791.1 hypothetical protein G9O61_00g010220 [Vairimorpha ceranae]KKO75474.1 hypothetical protein AAJ76_2000042761 [Vairimorpha ceranae]
MINNLYFFIYLCKSYRILKPKALENEDLYLTNINSKLVLQPFGDKENQRISIHKRKLFFSGDKYLSLDNDSIEIKLKKEKIVTYLKRSNFSQKKSDPFGFKNKKKILDTPKEKMQQKRNIKQPDQNITYETQRQPIRKKTEPEIVKPEEEPPDEPVKIRDEQNIDMDSILSKVKHLLNEKKNYLVESDSKIEEDTIKYTSLDVFIHPLNDKYIKLKTLEKDCVTYFKDSFIFTPCLNVDSQIFKIENEEDVFKTKKIVIDDEDDETTEITPSKRHKIPSSREKNHIYENEEMYHVKSKERKPDDKSAVAYTYGTQEEQINHKNRDYGDKNFRKIISKRETIVPDLRTSKVTKKDGVIKKSIYKPRYSNETSTTYLQGEKKYDDAYVENKPLENYKYQDNITKKTGKPYEKTLNTSYDPIRQKSFSSYNSEFITQFKPLENKKSIEYKPLPVKQKTDIIPKLPNIVISPPMPDVNKVDSTLARLNSPDDFLQKIKNSVDISDIDDLL